MKTPAKIFILCALGLCFMTAVGLAFWSSTLLPPDHTETAINPPPTRIEWDEREVGGMTLYNPLAPDSLGRVPGIILPQGSILFLPRVVTGALPDPPREHS